MTQAAMPRTFIPYASNIRRLSGIVGKFELGMQNHGTRSLKLTVLRQVLPLAHSGSGNYNGTLMKKHPQEKNRSSQEKKKLPLWKPNLLKGRSNLIKKR